MALTFLFDGPEQAKHTILLAHGAGTPMDSASLTATAKALVGSGFCVARFEFDYMAGRRTEAGRKPPPRAEKLNPEYIAAIDALDARRPLIIGGKSMGGRVASMVTDDLFASGRVGGLLCLGYPFHPPARPEQLRTKHLVNVKTPTLIVQGTRDEFGTREDVSAYTLSPVSGAILEGSASISVQAGPCLHCMSIDGIKRDENISVLGARAESDRHRVGRSGLDRLGR